MGIYGHKALELIHLEEEMYLEQLEVDILNESEGIKDRVLSVIRKVKDMIKVTIIAIKNFVTKRLANTRKLAGKIVERITTAVNKKSTNESFITESSVTDIKSRYDNLKARILDCRLIAIGDFEDDFGCGSVEKMINTGISAIEKSSDKESTTNDLLSDLGDEDFEKHCDQINNQIDNLIKSSKESIMSGFPSYSQNKGEHNYTDAVQYVRKLVDDSDVTYGVMVKAAKKLEAVIDRAESSISSASDEDIRYVSMFITRVTKFLRASLNANNTILRYLEADTKAALIAMLAIAKDLDRDADSLEAEINDQFD